MGGSSAKAFRLGILNSHVIQYFAPLYQKIEADSSIEPVVLYCSHDGATEYTDAGFGNARISWDVPLLEGYEYKWLENISPCRGKKTFFRLVNPSVVWQFRSLQLDAIVIHGHQHATALMAFGAAKVLGVPVIMRCDAQLPQVPPSQPSRLKDRAKTNLLPWLYKAVDAFLAVGKRNIRYYRYYGVDERKIFMAPFSIDNARFARPQDTAGLRRKHGISEQIPSILFVGKFQGLKRIEDLLRAVDLVQRDGVSVQTILVGEGEERRALETLVQTLGIQGVKFVGFVNQNSLPAWYQMCDIFVLPSDREQWGLVVNEAMAAGLPVIASKTVGCVDDLVIPNETGFVFEPRNVAQLAAFLKNLVLDSRLREVMGANAKRLISNWSYAATIQGYEDALSYVLPKRAEANISGKDAYRPDKGRNSGTSSH